MRPESQRLVDQARDEHGSLRVWAGARKHRTPESYVARCRYLRQRAGLGFVDWRLVAVGWNCVPPARWAAEPDGLDAFVSYWRDVAVRPAAVGSCYNVPPAAAFAAWRSGIESSALRHLPEAWMRQLTDVAPAPASVRRTRAVLACARTHGHAPWAARRLLGLRDLRALARVPREIIDAVADAVWLAPRASGVRAVRWEPLAAVQALLTARRCRALREAGVSADLWASAARRYPAALDLRGAELRGDASPDELATLRDAAGVESAALALAGMPSSLEAAL